MSAILKTLYNDNGFILFNTTLNSVEPWQRRETILLARNNWSFKKKSVLRNAKIKISRLVTQFRLKEKINRK